MPFLCTADPEQISILARAIDEHCQTNGIPPGSEEREDVAAQAWTAFRAGITTLDGLKKALDDDLAGPAYAKVLALKGIPTEGNR